MKSIISICVILAALSSSTALASGSYDVICAESRSGEQKEETPIRYSFHMGGETWDIDLYRVNGVNVKEALEYLVDYSSLTMTADAVERLILRKDEVTLNICKHNDQLYDEGCEKSENATTVVETHKVLTNKFKNKTYQISQTTSRKDGTKLTLVIRQFGESDSGDEFSGTLSIESKHPAYAAVKSVKVDCSVTTP